MRVNRCRRIRAGLYAYRGYTIERIENPEHGGFGRVRWDVIAPGQQDADDAYGTLTAACEEIDRASNSVLSEEC